MVAVAFSPRQWVNRFVAAVTDISNIGYGVTGGTINLHKTLFPINFLQSWAEAFLIAPMAVAILWVGEVNALGYDFGAFLTVEAHSAYMVWI